MSALFEDNFELYGDDASKMVQGQVWASLSDALIYGVPTLTIPAWETEGRRWLGITSRGRSIRGAFQSGTQTAVGWCFEIHMENLPDLNNRQHIAELRDGANAIILQLRVSTTGLITVHNSAGTEVAASTLPCLQAGVTHKIQFETTLDAVAGEFSLRVDDEEIAGLTDLEDLVLDGGPAASFSHAMSDSAVSPWPPYYVKFDAIYSLAGTYNSSWPDISGVYTLMIDSDATPANMTAVPRKMFGDGVLAFFAGGTLQALDCGNPAGYNPGSGAYTLEGFFHFIGLPGADDYAQLFGRWFEGSGGQRSYRLKYAGENDPDGGGLIFEYTTDGGTGTRVVAHRIDWTPIIGHKYHIAVCRAAGLNRLFIDGVQQGPAVADAATYYDPSGFNRFFIGGEELSSFPFVVADSSYYGLMDELRMTIGVGRYTANFTPTTTEFPRSVAGGDADFASVMLLIGCDNAIEDESDELQTLVVRGAVERYVPTDGDFTYQVANAQTPIDDSYIQAALIPASGVLIVTANPLDTETVTLGAETYTFVNTLSSAFDVLIGADMDESLANLAAAINGSAGAGTTYGTGTTPNASATAEAAVPATQTLTALAITPGTGGNSIASTETLTNGSWAAATLLGGEDLPGASQFGMQNLPATVTGVRWIGARHRSRVQGGEGTFQLSFDVNGSVAAGADNSLGPTMQYFVDRLEEDPDTTAALTPTSVANMELKIERTA